ncbi:MAG: hypothetical protein H6Q92_1235, partial [Nitrospirae bacterium]|nr:hypothetical protein [Nitrospirota bacterium]
MAKIVQEIKDALEFYLALGYERMPVQLNVDRRRRGVADKESSMVLLRDEI